MENETELRVSFSTFCKKSVPKGNSDYWVEKNS